MKWRLNVSCQRYFYEYAMGHRRFSFLTFVMRHEQDYEELKQKLVDSMKCWKAHVSVDFKESENHLKLKLTD